MRLENPVEPLVKQPDARACSKVMADGHASAWPGSIFAQLCMVWSTSMQVGRLADHSRSPQHADTKNKRDTKHSPFFPSPKYNPS